MKDKLSFSEQLTYYNKMALEYNKKNIKSEFEEDEIKPVKSEIKEDSDISIETISAKKKKSLESKPTEKKLKIQKQPLPTSYEERVREQFGLPSSQKDADVKTVATPTNSESTVPVSDDLFTPRFPDVDRDSFDYPFDKPDKNDIYAQFNDDTDFNLYQQFLRQNPKEGRFRSRVFTGRGSVPLNGATVTISKVFGDSKFVFDKLQTDSSGLTPIINLPAPRKELSQTPDGEKLPYSLYNIEIESDGFNKMTFRDVAIYEEMLAVQQAYMTPTANRPQQIVLEKQPNL